MLGEHRLNPGLRGLYYNVESQRFVHPLAPIMNRLHRETRLNIASVPKAHPNAPDDIVNRFITTPKCPVVYGRSVVLQVDPTGHHHRRRHDQLQHRTVIVRQMVVGMQKGATVERESFCPLPWRNNECCVPSQPPFRPHLRPVQTPAADFTMRLQTLHS